MGDEVRAPGCAIAAKRGLGRIDRAANAATCPEQNLLGLPQLPHLSRLPEHARAPHLPSPLCLAVLPSRQRCRCRCSEDNHCTEGSALSKYLENFHMLKSEYKQRLWDFSPTGEFCLGITAGAAQGFRSEMGVETLSFPPTDEF